MTLSIVFPAYDEELKITSDILRAAEYLKVNNIHGEIIVVDDGSSDRTYLLAIELKNSLDFDITVLKHDRNLGKGFAVRSGILAAKHDLILYSDAGDIVPFDNISTGIKRLNDQRADIAHGSRKLPESKIIRQQDTDRKLASWLFNTFLKGYLGIPGQLTDTQCGFKLYKKNIGKQLFAELNTRGFLFEVEIILRAINNNYKIVEFPLEWKCDRDSRISFWSTTAEVIGEIIKIKRMFKNNNP